MQAFLVGVVVAAALGMAASSAAAPVAVRFPEGVARAFPVLKNTDGQPLTRGDLIQVVRGDRVENRLVFRFRDGSLYDETVVFSQQETFRLLAYRIVQRGPSFPETLEASIDRTTGRYEVRYRADDDSPEEHLTGTFQLPDDAYNGMLGLVLKNLSRRPETVSVVAFTPRPRVVKLALLPAAEESVTVGGAALPAVRWHIRPQLGLFASLLVADIPDMRVWILPDEAPAFLRAEGPLYLMGPIWRIEPY
ncbi:MAG: hypothetical protein K6T92_09315 [Candidatus Rokubacteria bacterium]|nr:hypothetical protein [Candidatus Rokubacteria bacterium]